MELEWGFMNGEMDKRPGPQIRVFLLDYLDAITMLLLSLCPQCPQSPQFTPFLLSGLALNDAGEEDLQPVVEESDDTKKEMAKLNFPVVEADMAPSAVIPKACQSLQKYSLKLNALLGPFVDAAPGTLTDLQDRKLVMLIPGCLLEVISKNKF